MCRVLLVCVVVVMDVVFCLICDTCKLCILGVVVCFFRRVGAVYLYPTCILLRFFMLRLCSLMFVSLWRIQEMPILVRYTRELVVTWYLIRSRYV